jgi:hypothetical protein
MNEAVDMAMDGYGTETDIDRAYQEVCDAVGIEIAGEVAAPGHGQLAGAGKVILAPSSPRRHLRRASKTASTS